MKFSRFAWFLAFIGVGLLTGCASHAVDSAIEKPASAVAPIGGFSPGQGFISRGCGFYISTDGLLITCRHVLAGGKTWVLGSGSAPLPAEVVVEDPASDLALLRVRLPREQDRPGRVAFFELKQVDFDEMGHLRVAGGHGVVHGLFNHFETVGRDIDFSAQIGAADEGAPVLDDSGRVIGIVRGPYEGKPGEFLAIPVWRAVRMLPGKDAN